MVRWSLLPCAFSLLPVLWLLPNPQLQEPSATTARHVSEFRGLTMGGTFSVKVVTAKDELESTGFGDLDRAIRSSLTRINPTLATIEAHKRDGTPVLAGTASVGPEHPPSELDQRLARLGEPGELFVLDRLSVGMRSSEGDVVSMDSQTGNGPLYPFSLAQKLERITEPHAWYAGDGATSSPWGRAIVPMEMISVLAMKSGSSVPVRTPSLGLFLDLEIKLHDGPVFVDEPYTIAREIVGLGQSRKTESYWTRTTLTDHSGTLAATVLLHSGVFKASYPGYPQDRLG